MNGQSMFTSEGNPLKTHASGDVEVIIRVKHIYSDGGTSDCWLKDKLYVVGWRVYLLERGDFFAKVCESI